jgi:hypothetical protein
VLREQGDKVSAEEKEAVEQPLADLKKAMEGNDTESIKTPWPTDFPASPMVLERGGFREAGHGFRIDDEPAAVLEMEARVKRGGSGGHVVSAPFADQGGARGHDDRVVVRFGSGHPSASGKHERR